MSERLIKSKRRVQKHGEVFTPSWMVEKMLNSAGIKEAFENLETTFLEPAAGEGNFLIAILKRKLDIVIVEYTENLTQFENFSLYALSTIYGVEILEDNSQMCVMNLYETYSNFYSEIAYKFDKKPKKNVLNSAKVIIKANIAQGDFLTRKTATNNPIIFSEWQRTSKLNCKTKIIYVVRTEYTLDEIFKGKKNNAGNLTKPPIVEKQLDLFGLSNSQFSFDKELESEKNNMRYLTDKITNVYKEELEDNDNYQL